MEVQRIKVLDIPVDLVEEQNLEEVILDLIAKPGTKQIVFLSVWDLLRARRKKDYYQCIQNADLILPISKSILKGARFLKTQVPVRYNPFTAIISGMPIDTSATTRFLPKGISAQTMNGAISTISGAT